MKEEIWKDIEGYEGHYQVSNLGRVRSLGKYRKNFLTGGYSYHKGKILKNILNRKGYYYITLYKNGKAIKKTIHRLVATAFIANTKNKPQVNHINGIKTDNRVENLEWCDSRENRIHAFKIGLQKSGEERKTAKLTQKQADEIRKEYTSGKISKRQLAEKYGVSEGTIKCVILRKTYKTE